MRRKIVLLVFLLLALLSSYPAHRAEAVGGFSCPQCTTYADGSQCCVSCWCNANGIPIACTDHFCPPPDGGGGVD